LDDLSRPTVTNQHSSNRFAGRIRINPSIFVTRSLKTKSFEHESEAQKQYQIIEIISKTVLNSSLLIKPEEKFFRLSTVRLNSIVSSGRSKTNVLVRHPFCKDKPEFSTEY
jgi:hypothetical protein